MAKRGRGRPRRKSGPRRGFALRFHRARKARGLTQAAAARELGVALSTLARWEVGFTEPVGLARRYVEDWIAREGREGGDRGAT
ncbi:MAG: helix-turn-helix transcriptional regulator [Planctomycetaceae bacterium]|nr:helix-turn-helix transcriptional regulator [Planctomycetaceae bacterium]